MSTYVIRAGDTFWSIAQHHATSVSAIEAANPGIDPTKLQVGQQIHLPGGHPGGSGGSSTAPHPGLSPDQSTALNAHNNARRAKGYGPLSWDANLAAGAHNYAQDLANRGIFQHSGTQGQGENLWMTSGRSGNPFASATQGWLNEGANYHGEVIPQGNFESYGHYTQCLWRSTTHVGLGVGVAGNGSTYVVGRYTPAGNMSGQRL